MIEPIIRGAVGPLTMPVSTSRKNRARQGLARLQTLNKKPGINFPHYDKARRQGERFVETENLGLELTSLFSGFQVHEDATEQNDAAGSSL
jgi:hypothetical protein